MKTLVMKFGGASVATAEQFAACATIIQARLAEYKRLVVVVSAMKGMTNALEALAHTVNENPSPREHDMLLSAGERISMALLAMALEKKGIEAVSFTGSQTGIITSSDHNEAKILDLRPFRLEPHLDAGKVVIVAGFQGVSKEKEVTTLGRGGSDTTAVALAIALEAEKVEFYKDVPGVFDKDPKKDPKAILKEKLSYPELLSILRQGSGVLHERCVLLAEANGIPLQIRSFIAFKPEEEAGTRVAGPNSKKATVSYESLSLLSKS